MAERTVQSKAATTADLQADSSAARTDLVEVAQMDEKRVAKTVARMGNFLVASRDSL